MDVFNWNEALEETVFDQPCKFGNRAGTHSVYCKSKHKDSPRKCHRSWFYGEDVARDEDCPFYEPNPKFKKI